MRLAHEQGNACVDDEVCPAIRRQKWSDFNYPLIWAAAGPEDSHVILDWLEAVLANVAPDESHGSARDGWSALRHRMRAWGVASVEDLVDWISSEGLGTVRAKQYIGRGIQEYIFNRAIREDGNVAALQGAYVKAVVELSGHPDLLREICDAVNDTRAVERAVRGHRPHFPEQADAEMAGAGVGIHDVCINASNTAIGQPAPPRLIDPRPRRERRHGVSDQVSLIILSRALAGTPPDADHLEGSLEPAEGGEVDSEASSSRDGDSEYGGPGDEPPDSHEQEAQRTIPSARHSDLRHAFASLDAVDLKELYTKRACLLKCVPGFLRGPLRAAYRVALEEARRCKRGRDMQGRERAWKLFGLISRMLLHRQPGERLVPKEEFARRFEDFAAGRWPRLLAAAEPPRRHNLTPAVFDEEARSMLAEAQVALGELSSGRQVLESAGLAPGTQATLDALQDQERRPRELRDPFPEAVADFHPGRRFELKKNVLLRNLRSARRGAAPGPSGVTADHLKVLLDDSEASDMFCDICQELLDADAPDAAVEAMRLGRLTALRKPNGGVRGIVAGDVVRRLVSRTAAQQASDEVEAATAPFQYALSTRAGTECVAHALQAATDFDEEATVLSIDGIGAFDSISRAAMLQALADLPGASGLLPFVKLWYGRPSSYLWEDDAGQPFEIAQGEGGEQGDALMPLLYALGQHRALQAINSRLRPDERLFAFLDDLYVVARPERIATIYNVLEEELWNHARIRINAGKTQVWNRGGFVPDHVDALGPRAWRGGNETPPAQRGVKILGTPLGHAEFVKKTLADLLTEQRTLLERIPNVQGAQAAWLLLLFCAAARPNYYTRVVPPSLSAEYALEHDEALWSCLCNVLGVHEEEATPEWRTVSQLPFRDGGLGIRSSQRLSTAACWASWADSLAMIRARHPDIAARIVDALAEDGAESPTLQEVSACARRLAEAGAPVPTWQALADGARPEPPNDEQREPGVFQHGWQFYAARALDRRERAGLEPRLSRSERAHLRSQSGPGAGAALMAIPSNPLLRMDLSVFRVLLLRRLRLPLPLAPNKCRCRHPLDPLGDHRAACSTAGVLARRGYPLESAAARICREARGRVRRDVFVRDLNLSHVVPTDGRRIEVIVDGLPLFHGAQLAVDTTLVAALKRNGQPRPRAADVDGAACQAARRRKTRTYPELSGENDRARLVVIALEVGGRWSSEAWAFVRCLARARAREEPDLLRRKAQASWHRRFVGIMAVAAQRAFGQSLLERSAVAGADGACPSTQCVLEEGRHGW